MDLDISLQLIVSNKEYCGVEGTSPKRKWIMGVCDLNY